MTLAAALLLGACAVPPASAPGTEPAPAPAPVRIRVQPSVDAAVERFEKQQAERAEQAALAGRLAEAALAWEVLTVLQPARESYRARLIETRHAIDKAVASRSARAAAAQQKGDLAAAERAWLEVLSLDPLHAGAAQALRALERERNRGSVMGRFANPPGQMARNGASQAPSAAIAMIAERQASDRAQPVPGQRNQLEHASMLAGQGELDAAIAMLSEPTSQPPQDPATRALLANLHVQRAELWAPRDRAAAIADLERALVLNPRLDVAKSKLQQLKRPSK